MVSDSKERLFAPETHNFLHIICSPAPNLPTRPLNGDSSVPSAPLAKATDHPSALNPQNVWKAPSTSTVPSLPKSKPSQTVAAKQTKDIEEDEFGDFDFDDVDMERLDSLLSAKSSQHAIAESPAVLGSAAIMPKIPQSAPGALHEQPPSNRLMQPVKSEATPQAKVLSQQPIVADEFGEFPDIDFDMIDQVIATRQEDDSPLTKDKVCNPRSLSNDSSGLSFIKFSRYKILKIQDDWAKYTKTLSVAAWTDSMLRDNEEEFRIHRDCDVKIVPGDGSGSGVLKIGALPNYVEAGYIQLRGVWFYSEVEEGDFIHVCSLGGRFRTDPSALPIVLHSHPPVGSVPDDLVLIHHPDMLLTPTVVSDTVACPRLAVLKSRLGSSGLTSKAALIGTLRHALFGLCIKDQNFEKTFVVRRAKKIVRENAEALLGCSVTTEEAEQQLVDTLPVIIDFVREHTTFLSPAKATAAPTAYVTGHVGANNGIRFAAHSTCSIEEPATSPELGLKGIIDAVLETTIADAGKENDRTQQTITGLKNSLMALELKTGHNQTSQHMHMGQLSLYTLMLQAQFGFKLGSNEIRTSIPLRTSGKPDPEGAASGGLLLYLNDKSSKATHVAPEFDEFKSLIGNRNIVAARLAKASKPRGISLRYEEEGSDNKDNEQRYVTRFKGIQFQADRVLPPFERITLFESAPPVELPDVQRSDQRCTRCFENRSCMLYAFSESEKNDPHGVRRSHGGLMTRFTGKLQPGDMDYFRKWDRLIDLEAHATVGNIAASWLVDSRAREKATGESISSLYYDGCLPGRDGSSVLLHFRKAHSQFNMDSLAVGKGSHVVISTDGNTFVDSQSDPTLEYENTQREWKKLRHRMHVVRGFLDEVKGDGVLISAKKEDLDRVRDMCNRYKKAAKDDGGRTLLFRVDKDNSAVGIGTLRQNLINLFTSDHAQSSTEGTTQIDIAKQRRLPRLRDIIVRLTPPTFKTTNDASLFNVMGPTLPGCDLKVLSLEFQSLNQDQQDAVRKVVSANDFALVQGLPGTGKTSTLSFITRLLAARGKRVLITSYTNGAVDNVLLKLLESGVGKVDSRYRSMVVRVGPRHSCHEATKAFHVNDLAVAAETRLGQEEELSQNSSHRGRLPRAETLAEVMSLARIVCTTVLTVPRTPLLVNELFDVVIVDEAGQTSQPAILGALMAADSFVLVGDHKQLPPLVSSEIAQAGGKISNRLGWTEISPILMCVLI